MTEHERKTIMNIADGLNGNINRMCVTNNLEEFDTMYAHARKRLDMLSTMIYFAKFRVGKETEQ